MADRLTQLQDAVNQMADHFCNAVGIMQQMAPPGQFAGFEKSVSKQAQVTSDEHAALFAQLIARTAKDIDVLIDSLPSEESTPELQMASLLQLEQDNQEAAQELVAAVEHGQMVLQSTQCAMHSIAQAQLDSQALETQEAFGNSPKGPKDEMDGLSQYSDVTNDGCV